MDIISSMGYCHGGLKTKARRRKIRNKDRRWSIPKSIAIYLDITKRSRAVAAREAHNFEDTSSNLVSATRLSDCKTL